MTSKEKAKAYNKYQSENLTDVYIRKIIRNRNQDPALYNEDMIEIVRLTIQIHREIKRQTEDK